jgi:rhamnogalacturonyl hydrolase YesR
MSAVAGETVSAQNARTDDPGMEAPASRVGPLLYRVDADPRGPEASLDAEAAPARAEVVAIMRRVADWQLANPPGRDPRGWEVAPFYLGLLALHRVSGDERYREAMIRQGESNGWQPGARPYHADDHAVMQAYLELYRDSLPGKSSAGDKRADAAGERARWIAPSRERLDWILAHPSSSTLQWNAPGSQERWNWCDALFMAPNSWLLMWQITNDKRYLEFMNREWWATTDFLYSPEVGWFFRDQSFIERREPNGRTVHWSRGNGWVVAGLSRALDLLPRDLPDRPRYEALYRRMMEAALAAQQPDGLWRSGLLDPAAHPQREATGTSFMTFALAWGVNRGLLPADRVRPAVLRAWRALTASVEPDGKLVDCQPIGDAPVGFDASHTEPFGVGAFLLAGSEIHRLVGK